jgi:hypothetical protein
MHRWAHALVLAALIGFAVTSSRAGATARPDAHGFDRQLAALADFSVEEFNDRNGGFELKRERFAQQLRATLESDPRTLNQPFPRLSQLIRIARSLDGKLRSYSWDAGGGTGRNWNTIFQFRDGHNVGLVDERHVSTEADPFGPSYWSINQVPSATGPVYFLRGSVKVSTSDSVAFIQARRILNGQLVAAPIFPGSVDSVSVEYDFFSVVQWPSRPIRLITFHRGGREIEIRRVVDDSRFPFGKVTTARDHYFYDGTVVRSERAAA